MMVALQKCFTLAAMTGDSASTAENETSLYGGRTQLAAKRLVECLCRKGHVVIGSYSRDVAETIVAALQAHEKTYGGDIMGRLPASVVPLP